MGRNELLLTAYLLISVIKITSVDGSLEASISQSCATTGALRLVGGSSSSEGRVEICYRNVWGTVCDDSWDSLDAKVVCGQLGFSRTGAVAFSNARFGQGTGQIWLDDVHCSGTESRLRSCRARTIGTHNCGHSEDAGVRCATRCIQGTIRLVGSTNRYQGRVEVCHNNVWGTVCDDSWDNTDARVVCRQLRFPYTGAIARSNAAFGRGTGRIWLDNVNCRGSERRLIDCPDNGFGVHNCGHHEDAGVICRASEEQAVIEEKQLNESEKQELVETPQPDEQLETQTSHEK